MEVSDGIPTTPGTVIGGVFFGSILDSICMMFHTIL